MATLQFILDATSQLGALGGLASAISTLLLLMLCVGTFYSGKASSLTISTARNADEVSLDEKSEVIDTTNFTSSGWQSNVAGVFSVDVNWTGPYAGSESLAAGDAVSPVIAVGGGGPSFTVPVRISSIKLDTKARNAVWRMAITATSNGTVSITI